MKSSLDGETLAGSPFALTVAPGELSPGHCTAALTHDSSCLTAGADALVCVQARDAYGNAVSPFQIVLDMRLEGVHGLHPCT